ncbi:GntR family transcriptional regulator [Paraburkholderia pallida]|uniref:GntR family transcriptional regulator n=1 Tax=Paraburkholderia pallida TaxID=2547399 RepID=A0A4P7CZ83_9BURK|nr:GntR family transcriptional regulator [Paraburkholderia pallida]QBR01649.1 GntR family transcriptional regulator [Paraburkholderia pallida]
MDITLENADTGASRTMASVLADAILQDIVTGALPPGSKLKIRELADRYQAGVIPLREAVSRLAMSGFVEAEDQRGFRVTQVSREDLEDVTSVRQCIESEALRDAIESGNLEWEGAVLSAFHQVNSLPTVIGDPPRMNPAWERAHDHFHTTLLAGCRSKWLKHFAATLRTQTARYRHMSLRSVHAVERNVAKEHEDIVKAVLARDPDLACQLLSQHFAVTTHLVLERSAESPTPRKSTTATARKRRTAS